MNSSHAKAIVSHLDQRAFCEFFQELLKIDNQYAEKLSEIDDLLIEVPPERFYQSASAFFMFLSLLNCKRL